MKQNTWLTWLYPRLTTHKTKLKFFVVGTAGFISNAAFLLITVYLGLHKIPAEIISMAISLQLTFVLHDKWTYVLNHNQGEYQKPLRKRYLLYLASNSFGSVMTIVLFSILSLFLSNLLSLAIASVISMFWNYMINKIFIWRHS